MTDSTGTDAVTTRTTRTTSASDPSPREEPDGPDRLTERLARLVSALTLQQKVRLLTGATTWSTHPEPAIGLRPIVMSDGPAGIRGTTWDERDASATIPSGSAVAASWDPALAHRLGVLFAAEARAKDVDLVLAPTVNLHRTPLGGRHFECYSEDPVLTGAIAEGFVRGLQDHGVGACVKHVVANDSELERTTTSNLVDERTLRELYLAPFEHLAATVGPWSWMAAYNGVNGTTMTEHPLLDDILKDGWGSDALVVSDWFAITSVRSSALAGLDLAMPGPEGPWATGLLEAVRSGNVPESRLDDKILRLLRLAHRVGALEASGGPAPAPPPSFTPAEVDTLTREAAAAGFVLVKNDAVLPLATESLRTLAVIGPNARIGRILGGGSATVFPRTIVHPLDGLRAAVPDTEVRYARGASTGDRVPLLDLALVALPSGERGAVHLTYRDTGGTVLAEEVRSAATFTWTGGDLVPGVPLSAVDTVTIAFDLVADTPGRHLVSASGVGTFTLSVGGRKAHLEQLSPDAGADFVATLIAPPQLTPVPVHLEPGLRVPVKIVIRRGPEDREQLLAFQINAERPTGTDDEIAEAGALAAECDACVVVVGTTEQVESEGFDRTSLALPGRQDDLVRAVLRANPNTVVVVNAGGPVLLPWLDQARAVLLTWFPGQQMGNALADVLTGAVEPGGRMPTTWGRPETVIVPNNVPTDGTLVYDEGLDIGYRAYRRRGVEPAVPFGHGLGYTTWAWQEATVEGRQVTARLVNTGAREGRQVIQVYVSRPDSAVVRPPLWLAAFAGVRAGPGETAEVTLDLPQRAFEHWDPATGGWALESGRFLVHIGTSSADLPTCLPIEIGRETGAAATAPANGELS